MFWADGETEQQQDGWARFEKTGVINYHLINPIGFKINYAKISGQTILTGSEFLAAGLALAATATAFLTF